ncbi:UNVERIFIED_CONTAM: hypothetical protein GTU68_000895 [Idotea baltica]|nr:hypothetical protein [Idotea baltica]
MLNFYLKNINILLVKIKLGK